MKRNAEYAKAPVANNQMRASVSPAASMNILGNGVPDSCEDGGPGALRTPGRHGGRMPGVQARPGLPAAPSAPRGEPPLLALPEVNWFCRLPYIFARTVNYSI